MVLLQFPMHVTGVTGTSYVVTGKYLSTVEHGMAPGKVRVKILDMTYSNTTSANNTALLRGDFLSGLARPKHTQLVFGQDLSTAVTISSTVSYPVVYMPPNSIVFANVTVGRKEGYEFDAYLDTQSITIQLLQANEEPGSETSVITLIKYFMLTMDVQPIE